MSIRDCIRNAIISRDVYQTHILHDMEDTILKARLKNYESIVAANESLNVELRKIELDSTVDNRQKRARIALADLVYQQRLSEASSILDAEISRATKCYEDARFASADNLIFAIEYD